MSVSKQDGIGLRVVLGFHRLDKRISFVSDLLIRNKTLFKFTTEVLPCKAIVYTSLECGCESVRYLASGVGWVVGEPDSVRCS